MIRFRKSLFVTNVFRSWPFSARWYQSQEASISGDMHTVTPHTVRVKGKNLNAATNRYKNNQLSLYSAHCWTKTFILSLVLSLLFVCLIHHSSGITILSDVVSLTSCNHFFSPLRSCLFIFLFPVSSFFLLSTILYSSSFLHLIFSFYLLHWLMNLKHILFSSQSFIPLLAFIWKKQKKFAVYLLSFFSVLLFASSFLLC